MRGAKMIKVTNYQLRILSELQTDVQNAGHYDDKEALAELVLHGLVMIDHNVCKLTTRGLNLVRWYDGDDVNV